MIFPEQAGFGKSNIKNKSTEYQQHIECVFLYDKTLQTQKCVPGDSNLYSGCLTFVAVKANIIPQLCKKHIAISN